MENSRGSRETPWSYGGDVKALFGQARVREQMRERRKEGKRSRKGHAG